MADPLAASWHTINSTASHLGHSFGASLDDLTPQRLGCAVLAVAVFGWLFSLASAKLSRHPPSPLIDIWPWGSTGTLIKGGDSFDVLHRRLGPTFCTWLLGERVVVTEDLDSIIQVLRGEHTLVEGDWPTSVKRLLGSNALTVVTGDRHVALRKTLMPAFNAKAIGELYPRLQGMAEGCCARWAQQGSVSGNDAAKEYTILVATELILGYDESLRDAKTRGETVAMFYTWLDGLFALPLNLPGTAFHAALRSREELLRTLGANLDLQLERRRSGAFEEALAAGRPRTSLDNILDARDEEGRPLSRQQVLDMCLTLLFAGHDTSSSALMLLFKELHAHPEALAKLRAEQQEVVARHGPQLTSAAIRDMPYAEACIKELQRLHPIVGVSFRKALQPFTMGRYRIPKGRKIMVEIGRALKGDVRWAGLSGPSAPTAYYPERFLEGDAATKQGAQIPFGHGVRHCLGFLLALAELKVMLAVLGRGYEWQPHDPDEPLKAYPIIRPASGLQMRFARLSS